MTGENLARWPHVRGHATLGCMCKGCQKIRFAQAEQLDYSKPPPHFDIEELPRDMRMTLQTAGVLGPNAIAAGWSRFKTRNCPPGLEVVQTVAGGRWRWGLAGECTSLGSSDEFSEAMAAAWAWYDERLDLARKLRERVSVLEYGDDFKSDGENIVRAVGQRVETTLSDLFGVVAAILFFDYDPNNTDDYERAEVQGIVDELLEKGSATFEGDAPIGLVRFNVWPMCLGWDAEQAGDVRRWLASSANELPGVLAEASAP